MENNIVGKPKLFQASAKSCRLHKIQTKNANRIRLQSAIGKVILES